MKNISLDKCYFIQTHRLESSVLFTLIRFCGNIVMDFLSLQHIHSITNCVAEHVQFPKYKYPAVRNAAQLVIFLHLHTYAI